MKPLSTPIVGKLTALHPHRAMVTPEFAAWAHRKGYRINTWTVDDPDQMKRLTALGMERLSCI